MADDNGGATVTIGLCWHSPNSANLGIGALTLGNMALIREAAAAANTAVRFLIIGFVDPGKPFYVEGDDVEIVALGGKAMLPGGALWQAVAQCDVMIDIGGGDSFTDIYGSKRFTYLWLTKFAAITKRVPLLFAPQTIGPFTREPHQSLAAWSMKRANAVVARDPQSFAAARAMAPSAKVLQATDVAFALPYQRIDHGTGECHVGLNVSGLLFNGGYSGRNEFGMAVDYPAFTRGLISALMARQGTRVHLVSHVNSDALPQDDDRPVAHQLATEFPGLIVAPEFADPVEAKSYIAGLDFLVAGRMHACIAAHSTGVPVVPIAYSRKFSGLFAGVLNYPHIVPVTGMGTEDAIAYTLDRLDHHEDLRRDIAASASTVSGFLSDYRAVLTDLIVSVHSADQ